MCSAVANMSEYLPLLSGHQKLLQEDIDHQCAQFWAVDRPKYGDEVCLEPATAAWVLQNCLPYLNEDDMQLLTYTDLADAADNAEVRSHCLGGTRLWAGTRVKCCKRPLDGAAR